MRYVLRSHAPSRITIEYDLDEAPARVTADKVQTRQLLLNVFTNAVEAIGEEEGAIVVRTGQCECAEAEIASMTPDGALAAGACAFLEVSDTGAGMDDYTKERLFDPFFSTKFTGRGLGMAAVLGIVRGHKGGIDVRSAPDAGASVRVLLSALEPPQAAGEKGGRPAAGAKVLDGAPVLLVDDEAMVRDVGIRMLERKGCEATAAEDAASALDLLKGGLRCACVILDWTMPGLSKEAAVRAIRALRPDLPIIVASGYDEARVRATLRPEDQPVAFIQKPFRADRLSEVLARVLLRR
jgi:CheY-like chemotaxis protein